MSELQCTRCDVCLQGDYITKLEAELKALRDGVDTALNMEEYDDDERISEIADIHHCWLRDAGCIAKLEAELKALQG